MNTTLESVVSRFARKAGIAKLGMFSVLSNCLVQAEVPLVLNHQGRVAVTGTPFTGTGFFKFVLISSDATQTYWRNAIDTTPADGVPDTAVSVNVAKGLYSIQLGETPAMLPLDATALAHPDVRLRVWFNDGAHGFQQLAPDTKFASVPYSVVAQALVGGVAILGDLSSGPPKPGTLRWNGGSFQGFNGARWESLSSDPNAVTPLSGMVWIRPGSFAMGSPYFEVDRFANEGPQTTVTISRGFWLASREVTQGEFQALMGSNPSHFTGDSSRPVEQVSWNAATGYCAFLTAVERGNGRIPAGWEYRLPTEAQWEYAARAGTLTRYYYGDDPGDLNLVNYAWYGLNSDSTHPVANRAPNAWGLFDMSGNVAEWCLDWYNWEHPGGSLTDPENPPGSSQGYVIRGGSWGYSQWDCRSASRLAGGFLGDRYIGFRVALVQIP